MYCPKCKTVDLKVQNYEGIEIDKCPKCKGIWLDEGELKPIVDTKEQSFSHEFIKESIENAFAGIPMEERKNQIPCPKCGKDMRPVNYNYSSGIVLDRCPGHGMWFDANELEGVQINGEHWTKELNDNRDDWSKQSSQTRETYISQVNEREKVNAGRFLFGSIIHKIKNI